jgi:hypothetical protein
LQLPKNGNHKQTTEEISKRKRPYPTNPPTNFCHPFRAVLLHFVYRDSSSNSEGESDPWLYLGHGDLDPPSANPFFDRHYNFIANKNALLNSLGSLGFFAGVTEMKKFCGANFTYGENP